MLILQHYSWKTSTSTFMETFPALEHSHLVCQASCQTLSVLMSTILQVFDKLTLISHQNDLTLHQELPPSAIPLLTTQSTEETTSHSTVSSQAMVSQLLRSSDGSSMARDCPA